MPVLRQLSRSRGHRASPFAIEAEACPRRVVCFVSIAGYARVVCIGLPDRTGIEFEMISQRARYALRALMALAQADSDHAVMISDLSKSCSIPKKFLEQILLDLKHHDLVRSKRGKFGGYQLNRQPSEIMFGEVLRIVDGPIALLPCLSKISYRRCADCLDEATCEIRHVFAHVAESSRDILDNTSLLDAMLGRAAGRKRAGNIAKKARDGRSA